MRKTVLIAGLSIGLMMISASVLGESYKWVDDKGSIHFTDDYSTIPEKYRQRTGKKVLQEDLRVIALEDSQAKGEKTQRRFSKPAVISYQNPIFSPDGNSILFVSNPNGNYDIFISKPNGTEMKNLTNHPSDNGGARWSPDGRFIIFQSDRDGQQELYRMKSDGTDLINLTRNPANDMSVEFSPDGNRIVFYRGTPIYEIYKGKKLLSNYQNPHLVVASADGSNQRVLVRKAEMPRWSPDGQWILYRISPEQMRIIHPDGSGDRKVVDGTLIAWTPDSKAIFYSSVRGGFNKGAHICLINVDGTGDKKCVENAVASGTWFHVDSRRFWDPTGSRIALAIQRQIGKQDNTGIAVLNRQGEIIADYRERTMLDYGDQVSWSKDGKTILFSKIGKGIYRMRDDGKETRLLIADTTNVLNRDEPEVIAKNFVDLLARGDFKTAANNIIETMDQSPDFLQIWWNGILRQAGAFKKQITISKKEQFADWSDIYVKCEFEKRAVDVRVTIHKSGRVAGYTYFLYR